MKLIIQNIKELVQADPDPTQMKAGEQMSTLPTVKDAFLTIENDRISGYGKMSEFQNSEVGKNDNIIDASERMVLPCWCDSHTHLVFAATREAEFVDRINGLSYEEIANRGGGILNSAKRLANASEQELFESALDRLNEVIAMGTGAIEIKSGYGLSLESELKMLRVIKKLKENSPATIKASFLGAHAFPASYKDNKEAYIRLIIDEMIPAVKNEGLADFIDVFCEKNYFSTDETDQILSAGIKFGLTPKIHVNQFNAIGGIQTALKHNSLSVDHLEIMRPEDIDSLKGSGTMPTALPSCSFFLGIPYTPAKEMIDAGLPLALASDYNPGSTPSGNMNFVIALGCVRMGLTPEQAINAATINSAYAMGVQDELGSITIGKKANVIITDKIPSYSFIPYSFGKHVVDTVILNGKVVHQKGVPSM